ncbi:MAG: 4Fe-4S dicluster domain-containing protein [Anaerolineales bacterium]|nr:4Fe-4S dicluster domain-containing protein [Anaerolineales bacterium]
MKQIKVDVSKCSGCGQCVLTCSFKNVGTFDLSQSNIRIIQWEDICLSIPILCQQCKDTPCVASCPTEAITVNPDTGAIDIDKNLCVQCNSCIDECRYQVIHIDLEGYPCTCDLCNGEPKCVMVCYPGAITFEEIPEQDKEPFKPIAQLLVLKTAGKPVSPPTEFVTRNF